MAHHKAQLTLHSCIPSSLIYKNKQLKASLSSEEISVSFVQGGKSMSSDSRKVVVHLRATGDAPILKQTKFKIAGSDKFIRVVEFLRRQLHRETLFVYVNSAFSPNPDQLIIDLYNNFGIDGKLVVNYACSMAWG